MNDDTPLLSIVTVTYNASRLLPYTLESISKQSLRDFECVFIDGESTDSTLDIINGFDIERKIVVSEKDKGIYDAMNKGIRYARGKFLLFLNAGDSLHIPESIQRFATAYSQHPHADVFYGQTNIVDINRTFLAPRHLTAPGKNLNANSFKDGMLVCHQAFIARKEIVPFYNTIYRFSSDFDWCIKVLEKSSENIYLGDEAFVDYLNEGTTLKNHRASLIERYKIMNRHYGHVVTFCNHIRFCFRAFKRKF